MDRDTYIRTDSKNPLMYIKTNGSLTVQYTDFPTVLSYERCHYHRDVINCFTYPVTIELIDTVIEGDVKFVKEHGYIKMDNKSKVGGNLINCTLIQ